MTRARALLTLTALLALSGAPARAAEAPKESDYYAITTLPIPAGVVLEVGALELLPGDVLAVATRRGDIYLVEKPFAREPKELAFTKFAGGLHEVLGLAYRDGWLYATQRGELSRLKDTDGDRQADEFETVCDAWEVSGDYHEYAFGSKFDRDGNLWVALCLTGSFTSDCKFRGWALRVTPNGKAVPTCSGLRSPGGVGMNAEGDLFYTENQGPWNGACALKHLKPGAFLGHPAGLRWYEDSGLPGPKPATPESGSRMAVEAKKIPQLLPPAVYFPYPKMGQSASGIVCDTTGGKFGPFEGQMFVGDQSASTVMRVDLEKVNGRYQGACFPFRSGFASGNLALLLAPDGSLFVGGTNRGWGSRGPKPYALERLNWTGKTPFEVRTLRARPDGFALTFTAPVDPSSAADPASYRMRTHTYIYQSSYGSPEVDETRPEIRSASVSADGLTVRLAVSRLVEGHVHELHLDGVRSAEGRPLLHAVAYYTMNAIPGGGAHDDKADPAALAHDILDDSKPAAERETLIRDHPGLSAALIQAMTGDLTPGTKEEYRRIPWIWRVAIAAGKRNSGDEMRRILDAALPGTGAPLDDWRAVVIGGGLINGITQAGDWPAERLETILKDDPGLPARWARSLGLAAVMADDENVPTGTRYDALRMVGATPWDRSGAQLFRYLVKGVHPELQQGAVSALGDVRSPCTAQALLSGIGHYTPGNRGFALDALLRDESRASALLDAVADGRLKKAELGDKRVAALRNFPADAVRTRAAELLAK